MDFFKSQESARHNTTVLVLLFILAVACMIVLTNLLVMFTFGYFDPESLQEAVKGVDYIIHNGAVISSQDKDHIFRSSTRCYYYSS